MKTKLLAVISILFLCVSSVSKAETPGAERFGLGILIGFQSALTGKYWIDQQNAIDMGMSFDNNSVDVIYGDYLYEFPGVFGHDNKFVTGLIPYVGLGGGLMLWNDGGWCKRFTCSDGQKNGVSILARAPLGIEWYPSHPPLGIFLELTPQLMVLPSTSGYISAGLGLRYYF